MEHPAFKAYDIRGVYGETLTEEDAYNVGRATVNYLGADTFIIARDVRNSSEALFNRLSQGAMDEGAHVVDIGVTSTPALYFAINHLEADGGIMITASHNPPEYNGFKVCGENAVSISATNGLFEIRDSIEHLKDTALEKGTLTRKNILPDYVEHLHSVVNPGEFDDFTVVMDAGNAVGGKMANHVFKNTPLTTHKLYFEPDGTFPNHEPNPIQPENVEDLKKAVKQHEADIGIAWDGDADRFFAVDENGEHIAADVFLAFLIHHVVPDGEPVVQNALCGQAVKDAMPRNSALHTSKVGHGNMKTAMREHNAYLGGEHSGHYYFKDTHHTDNAMLPALHALSIMTTTQKPLSELIAPFTAYMKSGEQNFRVPDRDAAVQRIEKKYEDHKKTYVDGVTVHLDNGWFNIRKSNSEPVVRLNVETTNQNTTQRIVDEITSLLET